mgnify:FL=1
MLPYFREHILPLVKQGKSVLIAAHGNSLRALIMELEHMSGEQIVKLELATGVPTVYKIDEDGKVLEKQIFS